MAKYYKEKSDLKGIAIFNDDFGYLTCSLSTSDPIVCVTRKSQEKAILMNIEKLNIDKETITFFNPLNSIKKSIDSALIKVPKSKNLFELFLQQICMNCTQEIEVTCAFMTKYFSSGILKLCQKYFGEVNQSLAWKKARLIHLRNPKSIKTNTNLNTIRYTFPSYDQATEIRQYYGVFSNARIDFATQFLLKNLALTKAYSNILDLACGNGVIGKYMQLQFPDANLHFIDDSYLAIESTKLNLESKNVEFHWNDRLDIFPENKFDLVITNPPFHFGYETNIEVTLRLFHGVQNCLKDDGEFYVVANRHLNYKTHLEKIFGYCTTLNENEKFVIYLAKKLAE